MTSPVFGLPIMALLLAIVFWLTIAGANVPSAMLAYGLLLDRGSRRGVLRLAWACPWWITGFIWHGVYRGLAWVISVMLPPMAIFFPLFTILEDLGYLPRVAFNLDFLFKRAGAHGKQALTMAMGFGCNAAGIIATRVINSPRERLIAILTNNFVPCNGRFPTLIMLGDDLRRRGVSAGVRVGRRGRRGGRRRADRRGVHAAGLVGAVADDPARRGVGVHARSCRPYRRPGVLRILYTSLIDRTLFVLWRAMLTAAPAGAVIWILGNINVGGTSLAQHTANFLNPLGHAIGLDGVILLAYIIAIPANEIVVPTMMMVYMGTGMMTRHRLARRPQDAARRPERLDAADRRQPDAVLAAPQPVRDDDHDDLQGDAQQEVGDDRRAHAARRSRSSSRSLSRSIWRAIA